MTLELIEEHRCFSGVQQVFSHYSQSTRCAMRFAIFLPPQAKKMRVPVLYWLSGLTCNEQNFINKAGAQRMAAELGLALIAPDTSPRGVAIPGEDEHYDFGSGAGFYVDATQEPWAKHYQMATYVAEELFAFAPSHFPLQGEACGIFGHSMGGHGALTLALKNPQKYRSVSAFSPICAPSQCPWGQKAFKGYLGSQRADWKAYDASELVSSTGWPHGEILVDQGAQDPYLEEQLKPQLLQGACVQNGVPLNLRLQEGYDHSYYFIATFIEDHLRFHAQQLGIR